MSRMSELHLDITEDLEENLLTFEQIAAKYSIPFEWVEAVSEQLASDADSSS